MLTTVNTQNYTISLTLVQNQVVSSYILLISVFCRVIDTYIWTIFFRLIEFNHGNVPVTFKQFESVVNRLDSPEDCVPVVDKDLFASCVTPIDDNHDDLYGVPSYEALVLDEEEHEQGEWIGGETEALRRLKVFEEEVSIRFTVGLHTLTNDCYIYIYIFFFCCCWDSIWPYLCIWPV